MKSAAIRKDEPHLQTDGSEDVNMSDQLEVRVARIESDVQHIKEVTTDLRVDLRRTNDKIDVTNKRIEELRDVLTTKIDGKSDALDKKFEGKFDALDKKIDAKSDALERKFDTKFDALDKKIDVKTDALDKKFDSLKEKLHSVTVWALLLYIALAGTLLTVLSKGFKWI
jgi:chromosome segregation ATPase